MNEQGICAACGCALNENDGILICPDCGRAYHRLCFDDAEQGVCACRKQKETPVSPLDGIDMRLVGENSDYYLKSFTAVKNGKNSFNLPAVLIKPIWCFYRRMYLTGIITVLIQLAASKISVLLQIILYIVFGFAANGAYLDRTEKYTAKLRALPESEQEAFIRRNGGVNILVLIAAILMIPLGGVVCLLVMGASSTIY